MQFFPQFPLAIFNNGEFSIKIEFPFNDKIVEIYTGDNHSLFLNESGVLYGNGDNSIGQLDGNLNYFLKEQCSVKEIKLPSKNKITKLIAKNNRSCAFFGMVYIFNNIYIDNGEVYYWGGLAYDPRYSYNNFPKYSGIIIF